MQLSRPSPKSRQIAVRARPFDKREDQSVPAEDLLTHRQRDILRNIVTVIEFERGNSSVFSQGEDAHFAYAVARGLVRVSRYSANRAKVLAFMRPGDLFGLSHDGVYVNSAETVCPSKLYRIPWRQWNRVARQEMGMQGTLLMLVVFNAWQAQRRIMTLSEQNPSQKLATFLLGLAQHTECYNAELHRLELPITRNDLAEWLEMAPETVVRTFTKLENSKFLRRISRRVIELTDMDSLRRFINEEGASGH